MKGTSAKSEPLRQIYARRLKMPFIASSVGLLACSRLLYFSAQRCNPAQTV